MTKIPLVLGSQGQLQQLQPGDSISGAVSQFSATNGDAFNHLPGTVVYISSGNTVKAAKADDISTVKAVAISNGTVAPSASGLYQFDGIVDGFVGIVPGSSYFLSPSVAGGVTASVPNTNGQWIMPIGTGYSTTTIDIVFGMPIQL